MPIINDSMEGATIGQPSSLAEPAALLTTLTPVDDRDGMRFQDDWHVHDAILGLPFLNLNHEVQLLGAGFQSLNFELHSQDTEDQLQNVARDHFFARDWLTTSSDSQQQGPDEAFSEADPPPLSAGLEFSDWWYDKDLHILEADTRDYLSTSSDSQFEQRSDGSFSYADELFGEDPPASGAAARASAFVAPTDFGAQTPALTSGARTPASVIGAPTPQSQAAENRVAISREPNPSRRIRSGRVAKVHYCSYGCGYSTTSKLRRHEFVHRELDPSIPRPRYRCRCSKEFPRKDSLQRHMIKGCKGGQNSYVCQCYDPFVSRTTFTEHIKTCGPRPGRPRKHPVAAAAPAGGAAGWRGLAPAHVSHFH